MNLNGVQATHCPTTPLPMLLAQFERDEALHAYNEAEQHPRRGWRTLWILRARIRYQMAERALAKIRESR